MEKVKGSRSENRGISRRDLLKAGFAGAAAVPLSSMGANLFARESKSNSSKRVKSGLMIDAFNHFLPPKFVSFVEKKTKAPVGMSGRFGLPSMPSMTDVDVRLRIMERYEGYVQILNVSIPAVEDILSPRDAAEACKIANDSLAEVVYKYPDRFVAATACLPLNDMDAAMKELDRAILELHLKGIQIYSNIMNKPLESPEFDPLFEKMNYYNLPIQIHPKTREGLEKYGNGNAILWPYETTAAMEGIVNSGMFEKYPNLKILTHHLGGVTPYHIERIIHFSQTGSHRYGTGRSSSPYLPKPLIDYYKMFYGDTACYGATSTLMNGYALFGTDHMLFGTDAPWDAADGDIFIRETIQSVEEMDICEEERVKIFEGNARRLFRLPV